MAGQAAHDLFLDKAMPGHTRASAAADECAGTFSQEVASVQIKLNMCHLTNQSYDDEDEEPDKTRDADPTNDPWNKLLLQSAARPLKKRVHSHMAIEDLPKCPTMAIEDAPSVDGQKPGAASSMDVPANASKDATAVAATPPMVPCVPLNARANAEMPNDGEPKPKRVKKTFASRYQPKSERSALLWEVTRDAYDISVSHRVAAPSKHEDSFYKWCQQAFGAIPEDQQPSADSDLKTFYMDIAVREAAKWVEAHPSLCCVD